MSVKIRLSRVGRRKKPHYQVIVSDAKSPRDGAFLEKIGHYSPLLHKDDENRFKYDWSKLLKWLSQGAIPTDPIIRLLSKDPNRNKIPEVIKARLRI